jgi:hypothetical protein
MAEIHLQQSAVGDGDEIRLQYLQIQRQLPASLQRRSAGSAACLAGAAIAVQRLSGLPGGLCIGGDIEAAVTALSIKGRAWRASGILLSVL